MWLLDVRLKLRTTFSHLKSHPHNTLQTHTARTERHTEGGGSWWELEMAMLSTKSTLTQTQGRLKLRTTFWVELPGGKPLHICSFYRPPSSGVNPLCSLENSFEKITQSGQNLVISGDFNCGDGDWDSSTVKPDAYDCAPNQKLLDIANNCSLTNVQQQAARRSRALDIYLTTNSFSSKKCNSGPRHVRSWRHDSDWHWHPSYLFKT